MAELERTGGVAEVSTSGMHKGPGSAIDELLASWDDFQLLQLTDFYRDRLEQAMEGRVHEVTLALTAENQFSGEERRKISDLADKGERADSSKLLLSLVMEKGSRARRVMWETFVKMRIGVPNLDKILKEIQERGCDHARRSNSAEGLLEVLSDLKAGKRSVLNTLHYLFESQNRGLAQAAIGSVETLSFSGMTLTPIDCAVLSDAIGLCDTIKQLNLWNCHIRCEGIQQLGPGLHKCQELRLGENNLEDSGVKLVSAALRNPECKIQKLWLWSFGLTDSGAEDLASALSMNPSLTELNLGSNLLTDQSVPALRHLILTLPSLERVGLGGNRFSCTGRNDLISLQVPRPRVTVDL